jgi:hypothetical protein
MRSALGYPEMTGSRSMRIRWDWVLAAIVGALVAVVALRVTM